MVVEKVETLLVREVMETRRICDYCLRLVRSKKWSPLASKLACKEGSISWMVLRGSSWSLDEGLRGMQIKIKAPKLLGWLLLLSKKVAGKIIKKVERQFFQCSKVLHILLGRIAVKLANKYSSLRMFPLLDRISVKMFGS